MSSGKILPCLDVTVDEAQVPQHYVLMCMCVRVSMLIRDGQRVNTPYVQVCVCVCVCVCVSVCCVCVLVNVTLCDSYAM